VVSPLRATQGDTGQITAWGDLAGGLDHAPQDLGDGVCGEQGLGQLGELFDERTRLGR
jgi:hypothetical protein